MSVYVLNRIGRLLAVYSMMGLLGAAVNAWALPTIEDLQPNTEQLSLPIHKSQLVRLTLPAERVSVVAPEIADVQIVDPRQILVTAKSVGETTLIIWTEDGRARVIDVRVQWNTSRIEESIREALPDDAVRVVSMQDGVALRGSAHSPLGVETAMEIAKAYSPKVMNLMDAPGVQQVLLKVKVAEVARSFRDERGVNFRVVDRSFYGGNLMGNLVSGNLTGPGGLDLSDAVTLFFGFPKSNVDAMIRALQESGLLQVLAEPNLIARSGESASFLAGGEFPIPVVQSGLSNSITIEYKEFGVRIEFTPTVLEERQIHMEISSEVSDLDFSQGLQLGGFTIPVVTTRRANTVVRLRDGQTFAIAGLINQQRQKTSQKIPGLGDIPILGGLFKASQFEDVETEVLIMVTPTLVAPLEADEVPPLPTDLFKDREGRWQDTVQATESSASPRMIHGIPLNGLSMNTETKEIGSQEITNPARAVPVAAIESPAKSSRYEFEFEEMETEAAVEAILTEAFEATVIPRPLNSTDSHSSIEESASNLSLPWTRTRPTRPMGGLGRW